MREHAASSVETLIQRLDWGSAWVVSEILRQPLLAQKLTVVVHFLHTVEVRLVARRLLTDLSAVAPDEQLSNCGVVDGWDLLSALCE